MSREVRLGGIVLCLGVHGLVGQRWLTSLIQTRRRRDGR